MRTLTTRVTTGTKIQLTLPLIVLSLLLIGCSQETLDSQTSTALESSLGTISQQSSKGAKVTRRKCGSCHYLDRNVRKIGPSLKGIMGKKPSVSGIPFDSWTEENMDMWIKSPRDVFKKTRMALPGISDPEERKAIIDYLKLL